MTPGPESARAEARPRAPLIAIASPIAARQWWSAPRPTCYE